MALNVLLPIGETAESLLAAVRPATVPDDRPYVVANMITSIDGSIAIDGESGSINAHAPGDRTIFRALRDHADAVLAGTGTIATEGYRRLIATPERRRDRVARGLAPDALAVVLSRSGRIPRDVPMLDDPAQPMRIFFGEGAEPEAALRTLREDGIEVLLCEGGPTLLGDLIRRGLVDDLFLTIAPVIGSGVAEHTLLGGVPDHPRTAELRWLLEEGGGLHARYAMLAQSPDPQRAEETQGALHTR